MAVAFLFNGLVKVGGCVMRTSKNGECCETAALLFIALLAATVCPLDYRTQQQQLRTCPVLATVNADIDAFNLATTAGPGDAF